MTLATREMVAMYWAVSDALERRSRESLAGAAFRVWRANCSAPNVLECARVVLTMTGAPPHAQWSALAEAAAHVTKSPPPTKGATECRKQPSTLPPPRRRLQRRLPIQS